MVCFAADVLWGALTDCRMVPTMTASVLWQWTHKIKQLHEGHVPRTCSRCLLMPKSWTLCCCNLMKAASACNCIHRLSWSGACTVVHHVKGAIAACMVITSCTGLLTEKASNSRQKMLPGLHARCHVPQDFMSSDGVQKMHSCAAAGQHGSSDFTLVCCACCCSASWTACCT